MDWKEISSPPKEQHGWFAVAVLPRNHSGSQEKDKCDLEGDNGWRKSFGFSKAWFNNGQWFEPSSTGGRSNNVTEIVTHWDYMPEVPVLATSFTPTSIGWLDRAKSKEDIRNIAYREWEFDQKTNPNAVNPEAFAYGFYVAMRFAGLV